MTKYEVVEVVGGFCVVRRTRKNLFGTYIRYYCESRSGFEWTRYPYLACFLSSIDAADLAERFSGHWRKDRREKIQNGRVLKTYAAILLVALSFSTLSAQATQGSIGERDVILITPDYASRVEYWGQKGRHSVPVISALETRINLLETKLSFQEMVNQNAVQAQQEYRQMVQNAANRNFQLQKDLQDALTSREDWKHKAKTRGQALLLGGIVTGLLVYIQLTN